MGYLVDGVGRYLDGIVAGCLVELYVGVLVGLTNSPTWGHACELGGCMLNCKSGYRGVHEKLGNVRAGSRRRGYALR